MINPSKWVRPASCLPGAESVLQGLSPRMQGPSPRMSDGSLWLILLYSGFKSLLGYSHSAPCAQPSPVWQTEIINFCSQLASPSENGTLASHHPGRKPEGCFTSPLAFALNSSHPVSQVSPCSPLLCFLLQPCLSEALRAGDVGALCPT